MRKLVKPTDDPGVVFSTCISRVKDSHLKSRLASVKADIVAAAKSFEIAASTNALHKLTPQSDIRGIVTKQEMADVYTNRMAKKDAPGRSIYDKLLATPAQGHCPLCGQRVVNTLDHHLPKTQYPALAVVPTNLIPACAECNKVKSTVIPKTAEEETIHPYFDDFETDRWLYAQVKESSPAALEFFVEPPRNWDLVKARRISYHFDAFKLSPLYASHAAGELVNIRESLTLLFNAGGDKAVNIHLLREAKSRESAHLNSWQTAMYSALAINLWYCSGGFNA